MEVEEMMARAERIRERASAIARRRGDWETESRMEEMWFSTEYAEPGYGDKPAAFSNWNTITRWNPATQRCEDVSALPKQVGDALEAIGFELEWSDEWTFCNDCGRAVRTQPDCYFWTRSFWMDDDGEILCKDCVQEDPESYLEWLEGESSRADTMGIDLEAHGYQLLEGDFQNGFHEGMASDPKRIAAALEAGGFSRFIFRLDEASQFYVTFSVYVHEDEEVPADFFADKKTDADVSLATLMKNALQNLPPVAPGPGIEYHKIQADGTVVSRRVSPQEFIEGIKD